MNEEQENKIEEIRELATGGNSPWWDDAQVRFLLGCLDELKETVHAVEFLTGVTGGDARYASNTIHKLQAENTRLAQSVENLVSDKFNLAVENQSWKSTEFYHVSQAEIKRLEAYNATLREELRIAKTFREIIPEIAQLKEELVRTMKERDQLREALEKISTNPYPEDIFTPISSQDWKAINILISTKFGMPLDRLSAEYGRKLLKPVQDIAKAALESEEGKG